MSGEWLGDASQILHVARREGSSQRLADLVGEFGLKRGFDMVPSLLVGCIDTMAAESGMTPGALAVPMVFDPATGKPLATDETPSHVRTAARLIAARLSMDEPLFNALIRAVPTGQEWGQVVVTAIGMCGDILRGRGELRQATA